jgi:hypothetical protein
MKLNQREFFKDKKKNKNKNKGNNDRILSNAWGFHYVIESDKKKGSKEWNIVSNGRKWYSENGQIIYDEPWFPNDGLIEPYDDSFLNMKFKQMFEFPFFSRDLDVLKPLFKISKQLKDVDAEKITRLDEETTEESYVKDHKK